MFDVVLMSVLSILGVASLETNEKSGFWELTNDQEKALVDAKGQEFATKFKQDLLKYQENKKEGNGKDPVVARFEARLEAVEKQNQSLVSKNTELESTVKKQADEIETLANDGESIPAPEIKENSSGKQIMTYKPNPKHAHNKLASDYLSGNTGVLAADATIDTTDVINEFGGLIDYIKMPMIQEIFKEFELAKHLDWERCITSWKATKSQIDRVIQQFVAKWTPHGKTKFTALEIPLYRFKINVPITPADVQKWIFGMYDESVDISQMPITKYIVEKLIKPQAMEDLEDISGTGVFVELDPNAVNEGDAGQDPFSAMNGFVTIIRNDYAGDQHMNYMDLGVNEINSDNILATMEKYVDAIDPKFKKKKMPIYIDPTLYTMYKRAYKAKYGSDSGDPQFGSDVIDFSNNRLIPLETMRGTKAFFATPNGNFKGLRHINEPGATRLTINKATDYDLHVVGEFRFGVGFAMAEAVFYWMENVDGSESGSGSIV